MTTGQSPPRPWALAAAVVIAGLAASGVEAACLAPKSDAPPPALSGDWCITAAVPPDQQTEFQWTNDSVALETLNFETMPGQLGAMALIDATSGSELWRGTLIGEGTASSGAMLLAPGAYRVVFAAGAAGLVYRAHAEAIQPPPPELTGAMAGAFRGTLRSSGTELVVPWTVPEVPKGGLWTIAAQVPLGSSIAITLRDGTGGNVAYSGATDATGTFRVPDLNLTPGSYSISLGAPPAGMTLIASAELDERGPNFATEPDDRTDTAHELTTGIAATGRLTSSGSYSEQDFFALTVPPGAARGYDVRLSAPSTAALTLTLQQEDGADRAQDYGPGHAMLRNLALAPGKHFFKVSGSLPPEIEYSLVAEELGTPPGGREIEPNDRFADATAVPASGLIAGDFDGSDADFVSLGVTGELRLWNLEASGDGLNRLRLLDATGNEIGSTSVRSGALLRLDHVLLPPGANAVELDGEGGSWLLRATPLGALRDDAEYEPDDNSPRALPLSFGKPLTGWLERADDYDLYTFHLAALERVAISVKGPEAVPVVMTLSWGEWSNRIVQATGVPSAQGGGGIVWQALLQPGDYFLGLAPSEGRSREPYVVSLEAPSFFDRPLDLEPNDEVWQIAGRPPVGNVIAGTADGYSADWFPLGTRDGSSPLVVNTDELEQPVDIELAYGDPGNPTKLSSGFVYKPGDTVDLTTPPAGVPLYLGVSGKAGKYRLSFGPEEIAPKIALDATLAFSPAEVAAFATYAQRLEGTLSVHNSGDQSASVAAEGWIGDERWQLQGLPARVEIAAGATARFPVSIEIPADADDEAPVSVEVALTSGNSAPVVARTSVSAGAANALAGPHRDEPIPQQLRGGVDVGLVALGAQPDQPAAGLFDGVVDVAGVTLDVNQPVGVRLPGQDPIPVAGVILQPARGATPTDRLQDFAIEVSTDSTSYTRVFEGRLLPTAREQAFAFPASVPATLVRLVPLSAAGGPSRTRPQLAEFEVIAAPDYALPGGYDIADRLLGGHVIRAAGVAEVVLTGEATVWPNAAPIYLPEKRPVPAEFVLGFLDARAAHVASIVWHNRADVTGDERIQQVAVSASGEGALGPWTDLGTFAVADRDVQPLSLAAPIWARTLRFTVVQPADKRIALPEHIEVREAPGPSILGAWGDLSRAGPFEEQQADVDVSAPPLPAVSHDAASPTSLPLAGAAVGRVYRGRSEDWYAVDLPEGTLAVHAKFPAALAPSVALALVAEDGTETPFERDAIDPTVLTAPAAPGHWRVHVSQPVASVVLTWDTSMSVGSMTSLIERMIRRLAWNIDPRSEMMNLLPFRNDTGKFLMPWSGDRAEIFGALHAYPFSDTSSDAEDSLLFSAEQLDARVGDRAVVIMTDASYSGVAKNEALWNRLAEGRVKVFSLHLPVDNDPTRVMAQAGIMHDWADAAGGHMTRFASLGDAEAEFRRLRAWLDRPADYTFTLAADTTPPPPGLLDIRLSAPAGPDQNPSTQTSPLAMAIILDASGSMLQRLGSDRRIDIAKRVLHELGDKVLPDGLPVALRVFGHDKPGSCESELFLPLAPLDRSAFAAAVDRVQSINLARTSIAASLRATAGDLAGFTGKKIIVLVTDGNETCGGDPLAEVQSLRAGGVDVQLNIVGFAIDDPAVRSLLQSWTDAGAGHFFDAGDNEGLTEALQQATALPFTVKKPDGTEAAHGSIGEQPLTLPPGTYVVSIPGYPDRTIAIRSGETTTLNLTAP